MKKIKFFAASLAVIFVFNSYAIPKSKAVVIDATVAFGAATATAAINGTTATTLFTGMTTGAAQGAVITLMGEYATATGAASSGAALAGAIGAGTIVTAAGAVVLTAAAGLAVYKFIEWLRSEKKLSPAGSSLDTNYTYVLMSDNSAVFLAQSRTGLPVSGDVVPIGASRLETGVQYETKEGFVWQFDDDANKFLWKAPDADTFSSKTISGTASDYFLYDGSMGFYVTFTYPGTRDVIESYNTRAKPSIAYGESVLKPKPEFTPIPEEIPDTGALVITSPSFQGLPQNDPQAAADAIFQSAIDGDLSPTVTVESDPTVTPEPTPPEDLPPNLPDLGETLTTRFPFSIPWDVGRVLDFLSAEPVAPHIHFQPFKDDLFGLPADTVVIDYDFSRHEDIAAICRTFEIVGFCLLLAVGTKRLIWTA